MVTFCHPLFPHKELLQGEFVQDGFDVAAHLPQSLSIGVTWVWPKHLDLLVRWLEKNIYYQKVGKKYPARK